MTNADIATILIDCADALQEYRNSDAPLTDRYYASLKVLERRAREAAKEVEQSRELNPKIDT